MAKKKKNEKASIIGIEIITCAVLCVIAVSTFVVLSEAVFRNALYNLDINTLNIVAENQFPSLIRFSYFISGFGDALFFFTLSSIFALYLYFKRKIDAFMFLVIVYSAVIINIFLKFFYSRPRPEINPVVIETSYSYPSFHAMGSFVLYSAIAYFIYKETKNKKLSVVIGLLLGILIILIGVSRVYLGVHYPSDVIAGYIAGFIWIMIVIIFQRTYLFEKIYNKTKGIKNGSK